MASTGDLIAAVRNAFSASMRPSRFTVESSDYEILRTEAVFASRTPDTLQSSDVGIGAGGPEVFLTQAALNHYMSGFARLVLDKDGGFEACDFLGILTPDRIAAFDDKPKKSIADVLVLIRDKSSDQDKDVIVRRLKRLRVRKFCKTLQ